MGLGKWILTGLGWSVGGPLGALVGFLIGKVGETISFDRRIGAGASASGASSSASSGRRYHNTGTKADFNLALLALMAAVMKSDNVVKRSELDYVKRFLVNNYGEDKAKELLLRLRDLNKSDIPIADLCRQIKLNTDYTTRYHMLDFLYGLASADGEVSISEQKTLHNIGLRLGINMQDLISIQSRHTATGYGGYSHYQGRANSGSQSRSQQQSRSQSASSRTVPGKKNPYNVLGLSEEATDEEIKKAYRRYAMKYHPDRVESMGEEVRKNAEEQFKEINEAYETLKAARHIK